MKHRLLIVLIFLLAGAVVNVAVAWGCALTSSDARTERTMATVGSMLWQVDRISRTGAVVFVSVRTRHRGADHLGNPAELLDDWTGFASPTPEFESGEISSETRAASARGMPMLALWCETTRQGAGQIRGGLDTGLLPVNHWLRKTPVARRFLANPRVLPLRPLWPGFAVNTIFYATFLWLLICGPFVLRRFIRMKRGRCVKCGYPMGGSDQCSECGKTLPNHVRA